MIIKMFPHIPSYSSPDCQFQVVQLLEHKVSVKKFLVLGAMLGAYAAAFAGTFPNAKITAVDQWLGEDCGLQQLSNSQENCLKFNQDFKNISLLKLDYTDPQSLHELEKNFDLVYIGGPITKNVPQLLSHLSPKSLIAGVMYTVCETDPPTRYSTNCQ
ncbi:hypothetical protein K2X05_00660, partial [bacterium]|nr:hypothetical protein [bacterium]